MSPRAFHLHNLLPNKKQKGKLLIADYVFHWEFTTISVRPRINSEYWPSPWHDTIFSVVRPWSPWIWHGAAWPNPCLIHLYICVTRNTLYFVWGVVNYNKEYIFRRSYRYSTEMREFSASLSAIYDYFSDLILVLVTLFVSTMA